MIAGIILTLTCKAEDKEKSLSDLFMMVKKIESEAKEKQGLKILLKVEGCKNNRMHYHILVNKKVNFDIEKEWKHGQTSLEEVKTYDQYQEAVKYICI